jgi:hypothetical protein
LQLRRVSNQLRDGVFVGDERIVAVALVTRSELESLGPTFDRSWPVDETPCFQELLQAIDKADRKVWRERDEASRTDAGA